MTFKRCWWKGPWFFFLSFFFLSPPKKTSTSPLDSSSSLLFYPFPPFPPIGLLLFLFLFFFFFTLLPFPSSLSHVLAPPLTPFSLKRRQGLMGPLKKSSKSSSTPLLFSPRFGSPSIMHFLPLFRFFAPPPPLSLFFPSFFFPGFLLLPSFIPLKHGRNHGCVGDHMSPTMSPIYIYI